MALLQPVCNLSGFITFRSTTQDFRFCALFTTRLWLNDATGQVLRNGLDLLGVSAPERM